MTDHTSPATSPATSSATSPAAPAAVAEHQVWERHLAGTDLVESRVILAFDDAGRAYVHEAVLGKLLLDAGWERTA